MDANKVIFILKLKKAIDKLKVAGIATEGQLTEIDKLYYDLAIPVLNSKSGESTVFQSPISTVVNDFGGHMEMVFTFSVDYSFIPNSYSKLKSQLKKDNLEMEYAFLSNHNNNIERFHKFVFYGFQQVENLINFFYQTKYPVMSDMLQVLKKYNPIVKKTYKSVDDIPMAYKIYSFTAQYFNLQGDYTSVILSNMRVLRNLDVHRSDVLESQTDDKVKDFLLYKRFDQVRDTVFKLSHKIKTELE